MAPRNTDRSIPELARRSTAARASRTTTIYAPADPNAPKDPERPERPESPELDERKMTDVAILPSRFVVTGGPSKTHKPAAAPPATAPPAPKKTKKAAAPAPAPEPEAEMPVLKAPEPGQQDLETADEAAEDENAEVSEDDSGSAGSESGNETESGMDKVAEIIRPRYNAKSFEVDFVAPNEPAPILFDYDDAPVNTQETIGESKPTSGKVKPTRRTKVVWYATEAEEKNGKIEARMVDGKTIRHIVAETKSWDSTRKCYYYGPVGRWENGRRWTDRRDIFQFIRELVPEENRRALPPTMGAPKGRKRSAKNAGLEAIETNVARVRELENEINAKDNEIKAKDNEIKRDREAVRQEIRDIQSAADASIKKKKAKIATLATKIATLEDKNERLEAKNDRLETKCDNLVQQMRNP